MPAFFALSSTRAMGLLTAQLRVIAVAYWANDMTCRLADLTRRGQPRGSVMLLPNIAEGQHNSLIRQVLRAI